MNPGNQDSSGARQRFDGRNALNSGEFSYRQDSLPTMATPHPLCIDRQNRARFPRASSLKSHMRILLTNDDGIYAPGLEALHDELQRLGSVDVVAPSVEQSGVSHSITYLEPLLAHEVFRHGRLFGRAVRGSPADCVKLAMLQICNTPPDHVGRLRGRGAVPDT